MLERRRILRTIMQIFWCFYINEWIHVFVSWMFCRTQRMKTAFPFPYVLMRTKCIRCRVVALLTCWSKHCPSNVCTFNTAQCNAYIVKSNLTVTRKKECLPFSPHYFQFSLNIYMYTYKYASDIQDTGWYEKFCTALFPRKCVRIKMFYFSALHIKSIHSNPVITHF